jgi:hypothetical protein
MEEEAAYIIKITAMREKAFADQLESADKINESLEKEIESSRRQLEILQYGEEAYFALESARLNDAIATAEQIVAQGQLNGLTGEALEYAEEYIRKLKEQAELRKKLSTVDAERRQVEAQKDTQKKIIENWDRTWNQVAQSMTNALIQGGVKTKDLLRNMFRTLILRPIIDPIMENIGKAISGTIGTIFSGGAQAGQLGGLLDGFGAGKSIFDGITQGFDVANTAFVDSIGRFGTWVSNLNMGSFTTDIGSFVTLNKGAIASSLAYTDAVLKLVKGDLKGAAFSAAGTAIGTAFGGPIGGAIGAFLGNVVGGLFGGKSPKMYGNTAKGTFSGGKFESSGSKTFGRSFGAGDALENLNNAFAKSLGAFLTAFDKDASFTVSSIFRQRTNVRGALRFNGKDVASIKNESFNSLVNKSLGAGLIKAINMSDVADSIKTAFNNILKETKKASERVTATSGLIDAMITLQNSSSSLTDKFGLTVDQAIKLGDSVTSTTAELIEFTKQLIAIGESSVTIGKRILQAKEALTESLGGSLPSDLADFDARMKAINKTTDEGLDQFAQMLKLREGFLAFKNAIAELQTNVGNAIFSMLSPSEQLIKLQNEMATAFNAVNVSVPATVQELIALGESIDYTTETGLNLAAVFPSLVAMFTKTKEATDTLVGSLNQLDINKFTTLANYQRAQAYMSQGMPVTAIPSYDVGTNYVPRDTLAMVHEGEAIIPKKYNQEGGFNMSELISEVANLRTEVRAVVTHTSKTAKLLDRVIPDGNSVQVVMA